MVGRNSAFAPRQAKKPRSKLSTNKATKATRLYEQGQTGVQAAFLKADKAARTARTRARQRLRNLPGWQELTAEKQNAMISEAEAEINRKRDLKKDLMSKEWRVEGDVIGSQSQTEEVDGSDSSFDAGDVDVLDEEEYVDDEGKPIDKRIVRENITEMVQGYMTGFRNRITGLEHVGRPNEMPWSDEDASESEQVSEEEMSEAE
jgi:hypothetical protein